jgi:hypothetical protein
MIKVSITLPNSVQITLESDSEIGPEIVGTVLRDLPKELLSSGPPVLNGTDQLNISQLGDVLSQLQALLPAQNAVQQSGPEGVTPVNGAASPPPVPGNPPKKNLSSVGTGTSNHRKAAAAGFPADGSEDSFIQFCRSLNPLGDMRKVVVAAEGAEQFLRADGVDAEELSRLFELAGWTQPHSFNQTLRNAARSKFRWIERMPGRNGRYGVTDRGKEIARQG